MLTQGDFAELELLFGGAILGLLADYYQNPKGTTRKIVEAIETHYLTSWTLGATKQARDYLSTTRLQRAIDAGLKKAREYADTVLDRLKTIFERWRGGESLNPARDVARHSQTITTITTFQGALSGVAVAGEMTGLPGKQWYRAGGVKEPRRSHTLLEGVIIPRDALFSLPTGRCLHPHDWKNLPLAGEWVNCRHAVWYVKMPPVP